MCCPSAYFAGLLCAKQLTPPAQAWRSPAACVRMSALAELAAVAAEATAAGDAAEAAAASAEPADDSPLADARRRAATPPPASPARSAAVQRLPSAASAPAISAGALAPAPSASLRLGLRQRSDPPQPTRGSQPAVPVFEDVFAALRKQQAAARSAAGAAAAAAAHPLHAALDSLSSCHSQAGGPGTAPLNPYAVLAGARGGGAGLLGGVLGDGVGVRGGGAAAGSPRSGALAALLAAPGLSRPERALPAGARRSSGLDITVALICRVIPACVSRGPWRSKRPACWRLQCFVVVVLAGRVSRHADFSVVGCCCAALGTSKSQRVCIDGPRVRASADYAAGPSALHGRAMPFEAL